MMRDDMQTLLQAFGLLCLVPLLMFGLGIWRAWVLVALWGWFALPLGAPALSLGLAWGVVLLAGYLTHQLTDKNEKPSADSVAFELVSPAVYLFVGWVVQAVLL